MVAHSDVRGLLQQHGYTEIKKVGEGSFGKAILVSSSEGTKMICKMVDVSKASNKERQDAIKEGQLLSTLKHPYIVRYRDCFTETGWLCILMDFCEGGEVAKQIQDHRRAKKTLPEEQIMKWFTQAILALNYIHDKHILHRDLKPQNFFLSNNTMKMGDFGIAKVLACTIAVAKTQIGTPYYLSPEVCQEKPYSWGSDVWAMGCILYEFCALQVPFDATNITGLVQKIVKGPIPTVPSRYSDFLRRLVAEMLNRNPDRRPSTDDILEMSQVKAIAKQEMQDGVNDGPQAPPPAARPSVNAEGPQKDAAGTYKKDDLIEYNSSAHKQWLPAVVLNVDGQGRIIMDLKPNTWLTKEEQAQKIRPRSGLSGAGADNLRVAASPMRGRTPSADPGGRAPSRGGGRETPMRQESPRQNAPWRAASPSRGRGPSLDPPGSRCGTPSRQRTPSVDRLLEHLPLQDLPLDLLFPGIAQACIEEGTWWSSILIHTRTGLQQWLPMLMMGAGSRLT